MIGMWVWIAALLAVAMVWLSRHRAINLAQRKLPPLTDAFQPRRSVQLPFLSVLVAAKDEEANIETAVRSLLEQDYPDFELIVINDRSTDRTAAILESLRAERTDGRLRVIHITQLREGWFGKNNAMHEGILAARGEWLCLGDADCRQTSPASLRTAMNCAMDREVDFLSVLPELEMKSLWERIIQPVCGGVMVFWFHPDRVNDPKRPEAYANGAFMLLTRTCLARVGGHEAVRTEVNEDMHLARLAKEHGQRLFVIQGRGLYKVRMYTGLRQIWRGWSRIFYGCFTTMRQLRVSMLMLLAMSLFPYLSLLIGVGTTALHGWQGFGPCWSGVLSASIMVVIAQQSVLIRFYRLSGINPAWAPTFIIGAVLCVGMLGSAMLKRLGLAQTTWRGTTYQGTQVVRDQAGS